jgi:hypothetical protein
MGLAADAGREREKACEHLAVKRMGLGIRMYIPFK